MKRPFIAIATGLIALAAAACGLPEDIVGDSPTVTPGPNVTPTATEKAPTPAPQDDSQTPTPTATPIAVNHSDLEQALLAAQDRWFETGYANYDFTFRWMSEYGRYVRVSVRNGQVTSVTDAETGEPHPTAAEEFRTIDGLFEIIREELSGSIKIEVEFDESTGAPLSARFDPIEQVIYHEIAFEVKDLQKVDIHMQAQAEVDAARAEWESSSSFDGNYQFTFQWICFCAPEYVEPVQIEVSSGEIVSVERVEDGSLVPVPQGEWHRYETIDGLFDLVKDAIEQDAASIQAEYHRTRGYPTDVFIDYDYRLADDERGFQVSHFAVVVTPAGG